MARGARRDLTRIATLQRSWIAADVTCRRVARHAEAPRAVRGRRDVDGGAVRVVRRVARERRARCDVVARVRGRFWANIGPARAPHRNGRDRRRRVVRRVGSRVRERGARATRVHWGGDESDVREGARGGAGGVHDAAAVVDRRGRIERVRS